MSLNLESQVNIQNASNCLLFNSKSTKLYKTKNPTYLQRIIPRQFYFYKIGSYGLTAALYKS